MVDLINSSKFNRWTTNKNMIYYNNYNVGIGTNNPVSKLHLYDDTISETNLTINSTFVIIPSPTVDISGIINASTDRYMIFTNASVDYTFTISEGSLNCDIFMIGGGGAGGNVTSTSGGGGGGAGSCIIAFNQTFNAGFYTVKVGKGQIFNSVSTKGDNSEIYKNTNEILYRANGGGKGDGSAGGCGGGISVTGGTGGAALNTNIIAGNSVNANIRTTTYANLGFKGGDKAATTNYPEVGTGGGGTSSSGDFVGRSLNDIGGGGIFQIRINQTLYNLKEHFANGEVFGDDSYGNIGGGGGAGVKYTQFYGARLEGVGFAAWGGGNGGNDYDNSGGAYNNGENGKDNTGGGGGGAGADHTTNGTPGNGGHGIVIIRYRQPILNSLSIEFKNFTTNYTIRNTDENFKITSTVTEQTNDRLVITPSGFVGIGTTNPSYMLEVLDNTSSIPISFRDTGYYFRNNSLTGTEISTTISPYTPTSRICAKFNDSILLTGGKFVMSSDIRIKENIQDINDDSVLQKFLAIKPKTYKYIDKIKKGDSRVYGFIAQQVKNVIPDAVNIEKSYIPNIMLDAKYNKNIIILPYKPTKVTIKIKDKIKCYDSENKIIEVEVYEIINEVSFKIKDLNKEYTSNNIFVYGTYVDDFHTLFTDNIFTLNVGATHELYRQIKKQKDIIKLQEDRMGTLERENDELENKFKNLLKELESMKE
jgi:hypothetical protein